MEEKVIQNIIETEFFREDEFNWSIPAKKIYKLHLQSQIDLLKEFIEHPMKPGYKRHDVLNKIKELEETLTKTK
jgi:hypothetical protein